MSLLSKNAVLKEYKRQYRQEQQQQQQGSSAGIGSAQHEDGGNALREDSAVPDAELMQQFAPVGGEAAQLDEFSRQRSDVSLVRSETSRHNRSTGSMSPPLPSSATRVYSRRNDNIFAPVETDDLALTPGPSESRRRLEPEPTSPKGVDSQDPRRTVSPPTQALQRSQAPIDADASVPRTGEAAEAEGSAATPAAGSGASPSGSMRNTAAQSLGEHANNATLPESSSLEEMHHRSYTEELARAHSSRDNIHDSDSGTNTRRVKVTDTTQADRHRGGKVDRQSSNSLALNPPTESGQSIAANDPSATANIYNNVSATSSSSSDDFGDDLVSAPTVTTTTAGGVGKSGGRHRVQDAGSFDSHRQGHWRDDSDILSSPVRPAGDTAHAKGCAFSHSDNPDSNTATAADDASDAPPRRRKRQASGAAAATSAATTAAGGAYPPTEPGNEVPNARQAPNPAEPTDRLKNAGGADDGDDWDAVNARREEELAAKAAAASTAESWFKPISAWEAFLQLTSDPWLISKVRELRNASAGAASAARDAKGKRDTGATSNTTAGGTEAEKKTRQKKKKGFLALFSCFSGGDSVANSKKNHTPPANMRADPTSSTAVIEADRLLVEALRQMPLDWDNRTHKRLVETLYYLLLGYCGEPLVRPWFVRQGMRRRVTSPSQVLYPSKPFAEDDPLPTAGTPDWERVGFQGCNPATDLRSSGVLGLLQALYLLDYYPALGRRLWQWCFPKESSSNAASGSRSAGGTVGRGDALQDEIPYVLVSFNVTGIVTQVLRRGSLDTDIAKRARGELCEVDAVDAAKYRSGTPTPTPATPRSSLAGPPPLYPPEPAYCTPSTEEASLRARAPVFSSACDYYVGAMALLHNQWQAAQRREGRRLTIADFGHQKADLEETLLRHRSAEKTVFAITAAARHSGSLHSERPEKAD